VAIKVLRRRLLDDPEFLSRFRDEALSLGRISHQNVVTVHECAQTDDGLPYIAMQFLEGETLAAALDRRGALPLAEVAEILQQAGRGLHAAHKLGIVHRDLKPDNIFLAQDDDGRMLVKIVDFRISKMRESPNHTNTGAFVGTGAYMSYEQAAGVKSDELDKRADVYSLGIVVYEMVSGRLPFQGDTLWGYVNKHVNEAPPRMKDVPAQVEQVVMKALEKDRDQRYATALDFAREFAAAIKKVSVRRGDTVVERPEALPTPQRQPPPRPLETKPSTVKWVVGVIAAFVLMAGAVAWFASTGYRVKPGPSGSDTPATTAPTPTLPAGFELESAAPTTAETVRAGSIRVKPGPSGSDTPATTAPTPTLPAGFELESAAPTTAETVRAGSIRVNSKDGLKYVRIPPGSFQMGCSSGDTQCYDNEKPTHEVTIGKGFWLGQTDVTQAAWRRVTNTDPSYFKGDELPVESVDWTQAKKYCEATGARLPTEAEWESPHAREPVQPAMVNWTQLRGTTAIAVRRLIR
jgi:serine/threonine-protein kinase